MIEWFDFSLYGSLAALFAAKLFFPHQSDSVALLAAFAAFGVPYVARPFGGILVGRFGDRHGRKPALIFTIVLMSASSFATGFLPTYDMIGIWAAVLLVTLRLAQGFGAGAEFAGALALTAEYTPQRRRGFYTALMQATSLGGVLLASLAFLIVSSLPQDALLSWGWRIPFLCAGPLCIVALYMRSKLDESPEFVAVMDRLRSVGAAAQPLRQLLSNRKREVALSFAMMSSINVLTYTLMTFSVSFLTNTRHLPATTALTAVSVGTFFGIIANPIAGSLCDKYGFRRIWTIAMSISIPGIFLFFMAARSSPNWLVIVALSAIFSVGHAGAAGAFPGIFVNIFPTEVRHTGIAFTKELSGAIAAGTTPLVGAALVLYGHGTPWWVAAYVAAWCLIGVLAVRGIGSGSETPRHAQLLAHEPASAGTESTGREEVATARPLTD
ncbi:MFS transporter [Pseudonocardia xishanensis]|uniref:MFS transporter n=1 Tax=Pseudonocardia xishanensis TaxID=630995 RepID=A0ABP8S1J7_9PSEU